MPIISIEFIIFFILFFPVYWMFKNHRKVQNSLIIISSLGWLIYLHWLFALTITLFTLFISLFGYLIASSQEKCRKPIFIIGVLFSVSVLAFFKYIDFFRPALHQIGLPESVDILMPLGLSYYVFQSIAYLHTNFKTSPNLGINKLNYFDLLFHFSFFPTITSGPIIRTSSFTSIDGIQQGIAEQIKAKTRNIIFPALAVALILLGIMKKWWFAGVIAENIVDPVFSNPEQYDGVSILSSIYGYTAQLFFDFSGYSDLVIGMAMLLGFQLPKNFSAPLYAVNIRDFWNRWHISLSTWIRDYIYIPLGGSKNGFWLTQFNLFIAMTISGIWHGYGVNFMLWGALHGLALALLNISDLLWTKYKERFLTNLLPNRKVSRNQFSSLNKLCKIISIFITFNFVCATFVIFRTTDLAEAKLIFTALLENWTLFDNLNIYSVLFLVLTAVGLLFYPVWIFLFENLVKFFNKHDVFWWIIPISLLLFLIITFAPSGIPGFIYANF